MFYNKMYEVFTRDDLDKMRIDHVALMERVKINDIVERIKLKVLDTAKTTTLRTYHWMPAYDKSYLLPSETPSKRVLIEICKKLQMIFVDCDIRVLESTILISWF